MKSTAPLVGILLVVLAAASVPAAPSGAVLSRQAFEPIGQIVDSEIKAGRIHGAVVEIGQPNGVLYRRAFGWRELGPRPVAMRPDTIFDLASLTKLATAVAIMQLHERGKIALDAPVAAYWPGFARNGKGSITIRELMTHYSGLAPDLDLNREWRGYATAIAMIEQVRPSHPPGSSYEYSDINYEALGEVVRRVSGLSLDSYCRRNIFAPLGMSDTGFLPSARVLNRVAPTGFVGGRLEIGEVNDPTAARMGGVAGHAGLFSTADDLARFATAMLDGGQAGGARILSAASIAQMISPQSPPGGDHLRGLGWDLGPPLADNRELLLPVGSYGHLGYTGTMLWIDPVSRIYVIVLANRTYPDGTGDAGPLRREILTALSEHLGVVAEARVEQVCPGLEAFCRSHRRADGGDVRAGADVLAADRFAPLRGARIGLITNQSGTSRAGLGDVEALAGAPNLRLRAIFSPEHGLRGDADGLVMSDTDPATGLPVFSLYGATLRPRAPMLEGLSALVFDVQDAGARFYTFATTMGYAMEAAARYGLDFYVLDRPDPITAAIVQGPVMDPGLKSFTGYFPMPTRPGMTMGELAEMFDHENHLRVRLHVIRMRRYARSQWFDQTGLRWVAPSPNLRTVAEATLYPGVGMIEGANVSVGRGTATPFELVGAPWIDAARLQAYLEQRRIPGVSFARADFIPTADTYADRTCHGVRIALQDRSALNAPALGVELIGALHKLYPRKFDIGATLSMVGSRQALAQLESGVDPTQVVADWQPGLDRFRILRARYLLY